MKRLEPYHTFSPGRNAKHSAKLRIKQKFNPIFSNDSVMINLKQLHHFWAVAKAGGIVKASELHGLAPQTLSGQIATLESDLGVTLFQKQGRRLVLTETGEMALTYADEIFRTANELEAAIQNRAAGRSLPFKIGVSDVVPKAIATLLISPAVAHQETLHLTCREGKLTQLLGELAIHRLDLVLADSPLPENSDVRGYSQKLGASTLSFLATPTLLQRLTMPFPACLSQVPLLIPGQDAATRGMLMRWLQDHGIVPKIAGEFDDSALTVAFGETGMGIFTAPTRIASQLCSQHNLVSIGEAKEIVETYYAISVEKRLNHPAVQAISRANVFGTSS